MSGQFGDKTHRWIVWVVVSLVGLLLVGAGVGGFYLVSVFRSFDEQVTILPSEETFPEEAARPPSQPSAAPSARAPLNILLLGSDTRGRLSDRTLGDLRSQRSDTIMVVHIPADRESIQVMSLMRDNWVPIAGFGEAKINAALSFGGLPLTVQTVESIIGTRIDHVAIVDFEGFKGMTDALGGVTVYNSTSFSGIPAGLVTLDGDQALTFVRERMEFADGDYTRARNQQEYLRGLIHGTLSGNMLVNPAKIAALVNATAPFLTVDSGLNSTYVSDLAVQLGSVEPSDITFFTSPTLGTGTSSDGQSIVLPDWAELEIIRRAFTTDTLDKYTPKPQFGT